MHSVIFGLQVADVLRKKMFEPEPVRDTIYRTGSNKMVYTEIKQETGDQQHEIT